MDLRKGGLRAAFFVAQKYQGDPKHGAAGPAFFAPTPFKIHRPAEFKKHIALGLTRTALPNFTYCAIFMQF